MPIKEKPSRTYLMENQDEGKRLELKTDKEAVKRQAAWAGIGPGMRVLDVGCGTGITTKALAELVGPNGHVTGLDFSAERLATAHEQYATNNIDFVHHDIQQPYHSVQLYDAMWTRFFLEYFRAEQQQIVVHSIASLKPGGIACLADLDNNSLSHSGMSKRLQQTLLDVMSRLEKDFDFDPYAGRHLYGHLYKLGFLNIACTAEMHHLIYGEIEESDSYNWQRKVEVAAQKSGCPFSAYEGSFEAFHHEVQAFMNNPLRFTYTPLIIARGTKPI
ncbi:MAG: methyltransferase domain-containing protein [Desulfuromusa sp.]|nr:methyltransferase domain-containing protein [Desulfuromusa sp.]